MDLLPQWAVTLLIDHSFRIAVDTKMDPESIRSFHHSQGVGSWAAGLGCWAAGQAGLGRIGQRVVRCPRGRGGARRGAVGRGGVVHTQESLVARGTYRLQDGPLLRVE